MSDNKSKYYLVTTYTVVRANSQRDALQYVKANKYLSDLDVVPLSVEIEATRINASEAQELVA